MRQVMLVKLPNGHLVGADDEARDELRRIGRGQVVIASVRLPRNPAYHRRAFSMFQFLFDHWTPPDVPGVVRDFEGFRKELTKAAGFHRTWVGLNGETIVEAESLAWDSMDELRFQRCVEAITEVVSRSFIPGLDASTLEDWARQYAEAA